MMNTLKLYVFNHMVRLLPPSRFLGFKRAMLRWAGASIGSGVEIYAPQILGNFNLIIGNDVFLGHETFIMGATGSTVRIENFAKLGSRVTVVTGTHRFDPTGNCIEAEGTFADIVIGRGAVVSTGSIVLPGKTVGEMAHVAAGSVVTHDVEPFTRVAGAPARVIKQFK